MAIVVQKYGGSSVADVEKLGRVADKVVAARAAGARSTPSIRVLTERALAA